MLKYSLIALAALGTCLLGFSANQASAFTAVPLPGIESNDNPLLIDVRNRGYNRNYGGNYRHYGGNYRRYGNYRHYGYRNYCNPWNNNCGYHHNNNYYYGNPWWVLGGIGLGYGLGYGSGYYDDGYYG